MPTSSDPQSDAITSQTSFSATSLENMVNLYLAGYRNLSNTALSIVYGQPSQENQETIDAAHDATNELRLANDMSTVSSDAVNSQILGGSKEVFINYLTSAGLDLEYINDLLETDNSNRFPGESDRTSFITSLAVAGFSTAPPAVLNNLQNDSVLSEQVYIAPTTKHLIEPLPYQVADDNEKVRQNLQSTLRYLRDIFRG